MKNSIIPISAAILTIITVWYIASDSSQRLNKSLEKYERSLRDSLMQDLDRQRVERLVLQLHIDSLSRAITAQKTELKTQINKIKLTYVQQIDYSKFTDTALVNRLLSDYPNK